MTPNELATVLRISPDKVRHLIKSGQLGALNLGANGRPRFLILPQHLRAFTDAHAAVPAPKPKRQQKCTTVVDFFPDV
jgi:excisionase family DNA binding protein